MQLVFIDSVTVIKAVHFTVEVLNTLSRPGEASHNLRQKQTPAMLVWNLDPHLQGERLLV